MRAFATIPKATVEETTPVRHPNPPKEKAFSSLKKPRIGELLVREGHLTEAQIEHILAEQKTRQPAVPFGELCIELGLISPATLPTSIGEEDVVLRLLVSSGALPLRKLNLTQKHFNEFAHLLEKPHGMILCVGPTGSGKTTTLHAALGHLNMPGRKIWTAEDPVKIAQSGLRQVQVAPKSA